MYQKISSITSWKHFSRLLWINLPSPRYPGFPNGWRYPKLAGWFHGKSENHMNLGKWSYFTHLNWAIKGDDFPISKPWFGVALLRKYPAFQVPSRSLCVVPRQNGHLKSEHGCCAVNDRPQKIDSLGKWCEIQSAEIAMPNNDINFDKFWEPRHNTTTLNRLA